MKCSCRFGGILMVRGIDSFRDWFRGYEEQYAIIGGVGGGQNNHSKGGEKRPILGKLRNQQLSSLNLLSIRFV